MSARSPVLSDDEQSQFLAMLARIVGGRLPNRCMVLVTANDRQLSARPYTLILPDMLETLDTQQECDTIETERRHGSSD